MKESEESLCALWDTIGQNDLCINGVPEEVEREKKRAESLFKEIMTENFQNLGEKCISKSMKLLDPQTYSTQRDFLQDIL